MTIRNAGRPAAPAAPCPNLADQQQVLALLCADQIGITLSEEDQLDPDRAIDLGHRRPPPPGQILLGVRPALDTILPELRDDSPKPSQSGSKRVPPSGDNPMFVK